MAENPKVNQQEVTESRKETRNQTAHVYVRDHTSIYIYIYTHICMSHTDRGSAPRLSWHTNPATLDGWSRRFGCALPLDSKPAADLRGW